MVLSLKELKCISGRTFRETKNIKKTSNVMFIVPARGAEKNYFVLVLITAEVRERDAGRLIKLNLFIIHFCAARSAMRQ